MKTMTKALLSLVMVLCLLAVPFTASAEAAPLNLMPADESGYTIVEGDGTVALEDGKLVITNNGDGDFRVRINNTAEFDLSSLNGLHMQFETGVAFKMAYHIISNTDSTSDWLTTTTDFNDQYQIDYTADRNPAGKYNLKMDLNTTSVDLIDKSAVYFDQFIILVTGKGSFTLHAVEMIEAEFDTPATDEPAEDEPNADDEPAADDPADEATQTEADETTTTTTKQLPADDSSTPSPLPIIIIVVAIVVVAAVCIIVIVKRRKA